MGAGRGVRLLDVGHVGRRWVHAEYGFGERVAALRLYQNAFALVAVNELLLGLVDMTEHIKDAEAEFRLGPFPAPLRLEQLLERDHLRMKRILFA